MFRADRRLITCLSLAMATCPAWAQTAATPLVDESKLPEWVKRQAQSPIKVIINSAMAVPRPELVKGDGAAARAAAKPAAKKPTSPAPPAAQAPASATQATVETTNSQPPANANSNAMIASPSTARSEANNAAPTAPEALIALAPPGAGQAPALTLLERVEPRLTPDLVDAALKSKVEVKFTVSTAGQVEDPRIIAGTNRRLNQSVLRAVSAWRYAPLTEPREHWVQFDFTLAE